MKKTILFIHCILILALTGCWDRLELEQLAFVVAVGIDSADEGGLFITYQIANTQATGENEVTSEIISIHAPDFLSARDLVVAFVSREITFTHTKVIIVSEALARSDEFANYIKPVIRERQLSRKVNIIISKENAADFIRNNEPTLETRPHKFFEMMTDHWEDTGLIPDSTIHSFFHRLEEDSGVFLATYSTTVQAEETSSEKQDDYIPGEIKKWGENPTQTIGSAVIKDGKMIANLTGEETRLSLLLRPKREVERMIVTYTDPLDERYMITVRLVVEESSQVKVDTKSSEPTIRVTTPLKLEILSIMSSIDYVEDLQMQEILKEHIKTVIEDKINILIKKTQNELEAEPFRWSLPARKNFLTTKQYNDYQWKDKYRLAKVNVEVEVELKDFGKQMAPTDMEEVKG